MSQAAAGAGRVAVAAGPAPNVYAVDLWGDKIVEYELWSDEWRRLVQASKFAQWPEYGLAHRGHIGLQGDHPGRVEYRSIRIRVLP